MARLCRAARIRRRVFLTLCHSALQQDALSRPHYSVLKLKLRDLSFPFLACILGTQRWELQNEHPCSGSPEPGLCGWHLRRPALTTVAKLPSSWGVLSLEGKNAAICSIVVSETPRAWQGLVRSVFNKTNPDLWITHIPRVLYALLLGAVTNISLTLFPFLTPGRATTHCLPLHRRGRRRDGFLRI